MKVYIFTEKNPRPKGCHQEKNLNAILEKVAETTSTDDLVVAVYLLNKSSVWRGEMISKWLAPTDFYRYARRCMAFIRCFEIPKGLPERFKVIRMAFGLARRFRKSRVNMYGWRLRFGSFDDHLAFLFAHELHHFRRYHLRMHPREGEQSACKWALQRTREADFRVEGARVHSRKQQRAEQKDIHVPVERNPKLCRRAKLILSHLCPEDLKEVLLWTERRTRKADEQVKQKLSEEHFEKLRSLPPGASVKIVSDDWYTSSYIGQTAIKVRTLKRNSSRIVIRTSDGKKWRWPMRWLETVE